MYASLFRKLPRTYQLKRSFVDFVKTQHRTHPHIGRIYEELLQAERSATKSCNFVTQVMDYWASNTNNPALRCIDLDKDMTSFIDVSYKEIEIQSHKIAAYLKGQGFKKGDSIALMLGQRPAWWYCVAALIRSGIAVIPCSRLLTSQDLAYRINDIKIRGIITAPELQTRIDAIRNECPSLDCLLTTGKSSDAWTSLDDLSHDNVVIANQGTTTQDPCIYLYTSGTTGDPKAVLHNHDYPFFHWPTGRRWLQATPDDLVYNASDTGWGFTFWITTAAWSMGAQLLVTPTNQKFDAQKMLYVLQTQPVSIFCAAPTVLRKLVAESNFDQLHFPKLKRIVTVGEALDEVVIQKFESRGVKVAVGFGQAETPLIIGRVDNQEHLPNTMGKPIDPYEVALLDENCQPVKEGDIGQIALKFEKGRVGGVMRGYANSPERTQKSFSPDQQYYLTGDWAKFAFNGFVYAGRRDDLIKSHGYRVGPDEIEKVGMTHPAVAKIAVVGVRTDRESLNISIKAFILLKPDYQDTPGLKNEIQEHIKSQVSAYKYPRLIECLPLDEWEKYETTSGKIRRRGLRERDEARLDDAVLKTGLNR